MPNVNAPRGFQPRKNAIGSAWSHTINPYRLPSGYAANLAVYDPVKLLANGTIAKAAAGDQIRGVVAQINWIAPSGVWTASPTWAAGTVTQNGRAAEILVYDDPNTVYEARFANSASVPSLNDVGATFNTFDAGVNLAAGLSGAGVDYASLSPTLAQPWRFMGFSTRPDNDTVAAYPLGLFVPALHDLRVNTGI